MYNCSVHPSSLKRAHSHALWSDLTLAMTSGRASGEPMPARSECADLHAMYVPLHGCAFIYISHGLTLDVTVPAEYHNHRNETHREQIANVGRAYSHSLTSPNICCLCWFLYTYTTVKQSCTPSDQVEQKRTHVQYTTHPVQLQKRQTQQTEN